MGFEAGVPLTNSLLVADRRRLSRYRMVAGQLEQLGQQGDPKQPTDDTLHQNNDSPLRGKFIVCKVFIGQCSAYVESKRLFNHMLNPILNPMLNHMLNPMLNIF